MRDSPDIIWFAATNFHDLQIVHSTLYYNNLEYITPETFKDLFAAWNIRNNRALANKSCLTVSYRTISLREIRVDGTWRYSSIHTKKNRIFITHGSGLNILILETCSVHIFIPINLFCVLLRITTSLASNILLTHYQNLGMRSLLINFKIESFFFGSWF